MTHLCKIIAANNPYEDSENILSDIRDMKLYLDLETGLIRCRSVCRSCGVKGLCRCYDTLEIAISTNEERIEIMCDSCLKADGYTDEDIEDMDYMTGDICEARQ